MSNKTIVAVYGTLMSSQHNHHLLGDSPCLGKAQADFYGTMLTNGGFPYLTVEDPDTKAKVELYAVNDDVLEDLDGLEGHPSWYERKQRHFTAEHGEHVKAWIYLMPDPDGKLLAQASIVPDGDWLKFKGVK